MDFYYAIVCPSCGEEAVHGINRTYVTFEGLPVISPLEQTSFDCGHCGEAIIIGELDVVNEEGM